MNLGRICKVALLLPVVAGLTVDAQEPSNRYHAAVRNNDTASLRTQLKGSALNLRDNHGRTPLTCASTVVSRAHASEETR